MSDTLQALHYYYGIETEQIYTEPSTGSLFVNLCPHDLTIEKVNGSIIKFVKPSVQAMVARIKQEPLDIHTTSDGLVIHRFKTYPPMLYSNGDRNTYLNETPFPFQFGDVTVYYIVSFAVQEAMKRSDILAPHAIRFDETNRATAWQLKGLV